MARLPPVEFLSLREKHEGTQNKHTLIGCAVFFNMQQAQVVALDSFSIAYREFCPHSESAPAAYHHRTYRTAPVVRNIFRAPYPDNFYRAPPYNITMDTIPPSGNMADPDHMAEFQKLSNHYEPDLQVRSMALILFRHIG